MLRADTFSALGYWSGGNDQDQEAGWKWTDGKPFAYFNWNDGNLMQSTDRSYGSIVDKALLVPI